MRFLVVGAGATGGYFGGRLLEAGRDVTFLVRPGRAARLAATGLAIASPAGDVSLPPPPTVLAADLREPFDVVILSCKAYDLDEAIESVAPAVGPGTAVVPLLNGMRHLDALDARFGPDRVLGGSCFISARLDDAGRVVHVSDIHRLAFGERSGGRSPRVDAIAAAMAGAKFEAAASDRIVLEMWEKWVFLASLAGITCLTRSAVGDVVAAGGADLAAALLEECRSDRRRRGLPAPPRVVAGGPRPAHRRRLGGDRLDAGGRRAAGPDRGRSHPRRPAPAPRGRRRTATAPCSGWPTPPSRPRRPARRANWGRRGREAGRVPRAGDGPAGRIPWTGGSCDSGNPSCRGVVG